jgi:anaerobic selenocysteine-containing dehydrogenase
MSDEPQSLKKVPSFCALCVSRCGATATVEDGRLTALSADPTHPTGRALCIKGKVAPELVYHPDRLEYPMKRTQPKGAADPGWQRISWDEALDTIAEKLNSLADQYGPEAVAFNTASPSTSALSDSVEWVRRLRRAFGSPNQSISMELCGWGRYLANLYSYGSALPAGVMPDLDNAGCILFWGYNPTVSRIAHATATVAATKRGANLIVVDPRNAGLARQADAWLQVRPGSDGALALGLSHLMIQQSWYDQAFLRDWTNAPTLVREDNGRLLRWSELSEEGAPEQLVAWSKASGSAVPCEDGIDTTSHALSGKFEVISRDGPITCRPVFQLWADMCARYAPDVVEKLTGVPAASVTRTAEMLWQSRPVAYMAWSGLEQQSNATQIARAIGLLYALTGNYDSKGGNVEFPVVPTNNVQGDEFLSDELRAKTLGRAKRPLGPARYDHVASADLYEAILDQEPYAIRGLVNFGSNMLLAHADGARGSAALKALDFNVHVDLFMNPSAELADIVLPATSPFESEGLKVGFEISENACSLIQLRQKLVAPRGEARSDIQIVFDLACRMGLGEHFWNGDIDAAYRHLLEPSGVTLDALRDAPQGVRVSLQTTYQKYRALKDGVPRGFNTPSRKVEFYSETLMDHGHPPLPDFEEPLVSHRAQPRLAPRYPLILTCTKDSLYCESQHRGLPSLRRRAPDPQVDMHPDAAAARGIASGDWVRISTPHSHARARARLDESLDPDVICGQHGWWQACPEVDAPGFDVLGEENANFNQMIGHDALDPVSGSVPLRAYVCQVDRLR